MSEDYITSNTQWYIPKGVDVTWATEDERKEMASKLAINVRKTIETQKQAIKNMNGDYHE